VRYPGERHILNVGSALDAPKFAGICAVRPNETRRHFHAHQFKQMVEANALMLAETGNLLLMGSRMKDQTGWVTRTQAMMDAANEAAKAAAAKNTDAVFIAGGKIYQACTGCHLQYINPATVKPHAGEN